MASTPRPSSRSATTGASRFTEPLQGCSVWPGSRKPPPIGCPIAHDISPLATTTRAPSGAYRMNVAPTAPVASRAAATTMSIAASPAAPTAASLRPSTSRR